MKNQSFFLLAFFAIILQSCHVVVFETPQPMDAPNLPAFPAKFQGVFVGVEKDDTLFVKIEEQRIRTETHEWQDFPADKKLWGDSIRLDEQGQIFSTHDSIRFTVVETKNGVLRTTRTSEEPGFELMSDSTLAREYDNKLYLNVLTEIANGQAKGWQVVEVKQKRNGSLRFGYLDAEDGADICKHFECRQYEGDRDILVLARQGEFERFLKKEKFRPLYDFDFVRMK